MHITLLHWFTIKKKKEKGSVQTFKKEARESKRERRERGGGMGVAILIQN